MQKIVVRAVAVTVLLLGTGLLISSALSTDGKAMRGDVPACHKACLSDHMKKIDELTSQYEVTQDKMRFQEGVEIAVSRYRECSDNCRILYPVK